MSAPAIERVVDPSGLNGERLHRIDKAAPYVVELYAYPATIGLASIKDAWLAALPLGSSAGFSEEGVRGGKRLVKIDRFEQPAPTRPHLDEPDI